MLYLLDRLILYPHLAIDTIILPNCRCRWREHLISLDLLRLLQAFCATWSLASYFAAIEAPSLGSNRVRFHAGVGDALHALGRGSVKRGVGIGRSWDD